MKKNKILIFQSFKKLVFPIIVLVVVWILKFIVEMVLGIERYRNVFNAITWVLTTAVFIDILYIIVKKEKILYLEEEQEVRGIPLILWVAAVPVIFFGGLLLWGGFLLYYEYGIIGVIPGVLFFSIGLLLWFESLTTRIVITKEGLIVKYHKIFPFPYIFYSFNDIEKIKMRWKIIHLKHKRLFVGAKRFLIFDSHKFIKILEKYASDKLDIKQSIVETKRGLNE